MATTRPKPATTAPTFRLSAIIVAAIFLVVWMLMLLFGGKTPVVQFAVITVTLVVLAAIVFLRVPTYLAWRAAKKSARIWRVLGEGFLAGVVFGIVLWIVTAVGQSSTAVLTARVVWLMVLGFLGALNALAIYYVAAGVDALVGRGRANV